MSATATADQPAPVTWHARPPHAYALGTQVITIVESGADLDAYVAEVHYQSDRGKARALRHAHLIATAPELLDCLRWLESISTGYAEQVDSPLLRKELARARAVIAKAGGVSV